MIGCVELEAGNFILEYHGLLNMCFYFPEGCLRSSSMHSMASSSPRPLSLEMPHRAIPPRLNWRPQGEMSALRFARVF